MGGEGRQSAPGEIDVPRSDWPSFLTSFGRVHRGWLVTIEVQSSAGRWVAVEQRKLTGLSLDRAGGVERAYIHVGQSGHLIHLVTSPARIQYLQTRSGVQTGLKIASAEGTTIIRFRVAMPPEMVNGLAA